MISPKLIRSFYLIEAEGVATSSIISGDFGIDKIILGSSDFDSDLNATAAMQEGINFILGTIQTDWDKTEESIEFNPDFFALSNDEFAKKQQDEREVIAVEMGPLADNQIAIPMTRVFDPMGDHIESRWALNAPDFKVCGKIGINADEYIKIKSEQVLAEHSHFTGRDIIRVH